MSVTERLMGAGNFSVTFSQDNTPTDVIDAVQEWGHIVITPQEMDPNLYSDAEMLSSARYTGIVLQKVLEEGIVSINGSGLQLYLGDDRGKGMVIAQNKNVGNIRTYSNSALSTVLFSASEPYGIMLDESGNSQAITQGTITDGTDTYSGSHFVETALHALKHICEDLGYEFRVNPDATLDAGAPSVLFTGVDTDPTTVVVKTGYGDDPTYTGISPVGARTEFDAVDYVTKVDFIAEVGAFNEPTDFEGEASKTSGDIPYYDLHGNKLSRTGLVTVPDMEGDKLDDQAQLMLNELSRIKKVLNLDLEQYEVTGDLKVGDYIFAFDPVIGFNDNATDAAAESRDIHSIVFRGQEINPIKVRVVGLTFPIESGMGVYFRKYNGSEAVYTDLTSYVSFESGNTQVELGDVLRDVGDDLRFNEYSIAARTAAAKSIPDLPSTPTLQSGTYLDGTGESKGFVRIVFSKPSNIDGSQITDGSHYRVRYRISDGLSTSGGASANEYNFKDFPFTGAATESLVISDLTVGKAYRVGVATVDTSGFRKKSDYTATGVDLYTDDASVNSNFATDAIINIDRDGEAPSKPKQAQAIAAGPLRVQVTHYLGKDGTDGDGNPFGNFTLEGDVDHLDIHAVTQSGNTANFTVNTANKIGEIRVTSGNLLQQIPVIGTMELEDSQDYYFRIVAVDKSGNESDPSDGQSAIANLIQEANISDATITTAKIGDAQITNAKIADATITNAKINDLSADKLTAGTIDASVITVTNLSASNINTGTLDANNVTISNLTVDVADVNNLNFASLGATSQDIINTIANDAILSTITNGAISEAKLGNISANKITTGTLDANNVNIDNLTVNTADITGNFNASVINAGTFNADRIPNLNANKITAGTISSDRISGTYNSVTSLNATTSVNAPSVSGTTSVFTTSRANTFTGNSFSGTTITMGSSQVNFNKAVRTTSYMSATDFYDINSSTRIDVTSNTIELMAGGSDDMQIASTNNKSHRNFIPSNDNGKNLGNAGARWSTVYRVSESGTSDRRLKENIVDLSLGLDFVNDLEPKQFNWISNTVGYECSECKKEFESVVTCDNYTLDDEGEQVDCVGTVEAVSIPSELTDYKHFGFIAQDMIDILPDTNDYRLVNYDSVEDRYDYSQEMLLGPLVKAVQELSTKVDDLTARIEVLEG